MIYELQLQVLFLFQFIALNAIPLHNRPFEVHVYSLLHFSLLPEFASLALSHCHHPFMTKH